MTFDEREPREPLLLTAAQVADLLGVSTRTLWRLPSAGSVPAPVKLGGSVRWRGGELHRWIADGCPVPCNGQAVEVR